MFIIKGTGCEVYGNALLPSQFFCKSKTILKESIFKK